VSRARLTIISLALFLVALVGGFGAHVLVPRWAGPETRAVWAMRAGRPAEAERALFDALQGGGFDTERLMLFLSIHGVSATFAEDDDVAPPTGGKSLHLPAAAKSGPRPVSEAEIDALLARPEVPRETAIVARFARLAPDADPDEALLADITAIADADPPAPWANRLLASEAYTNGHAEDAARRYLREGSRVPGHAGDVDRGLEIEDECCGEGAVSAALDDPRVSAAASPGVRLDHAAERRAWGEALRWAFVAAYDRYTPVGMAVTIVAALAWIAWLARLGDVGEKRLGRFLVYLTAFALGVLSIWPTDFLIVFQEKVLHLSPRGTPLADLIFFTFGVGFREELSKLVCFVPLVPLLRLLERGDRERGASLDALVCGALVGLGFAAVENLGYWQSGALSTGMTRFLTANFLHMAMTAITGHALYTMTKDPGERSFDFTVTLFGVMFLHGAYDFLLGSHTFGDLSWFAMGAFFLLTRQFVNALAGARRRAGRGIAPYDTFVLGFALVCAVTFGVAAALVGPGAAILTMLQGLLGIGLIIIVFGREIARV
jgi:RsiW-degrading membrane proteinase PrsW (M82 family)